MLVSLRQEGLPNTSKGTVGALLDAVVPSEDTPLSCAAATYLSELLTHLHLSSQQQGLALLHRGLSASAPVELFPVFTPLELEELFCGTQTVDLEVLKKATEYEDGIGPDDTHVRYFWAALEALNHDERAAFVNFCSGRSRLPGSAAQFPMTFKLQAPSPSSRDQPDKYLPIAQTCFFSCRCPNTARRRSCWRSCATPSPIQSSWTQTSTCATQTAGKISTRELKNRSRTDLRNNK